MKKRCGSGKTGARQQRQLLTLLMKPTTKDLSHLNAPDDFHQRIEHARQNYITRHKNEGKVELPIKEFVACFADGVTKKINGSGEK